MKLVIPAPAKINRFLHITGRLNNGYHRLQTAFQLLDYSDTVILRSTSNNEITLSPKLAGVADNDNLVLKAARLLAAHCECSQGAQITLIKKLPMGGGLGGGSSDAASTLLGLNQLWSLKLSIGELAELSLRLGADVPVFVRGQNALAEGVGERLTAVKLPKRWFAVIKPSVNIPTAGIFAHPQLTRDSLPIRIAAFFETGQLDKQLDALRNDCESLVRAEFPAVEQAFQWLAQYGSPRLTGTGSCLFASFNSEQQAAQVIKQMPAPLSGFVASSCDYSPAHKALHIAPCAQTDEQ
jgi:4-diphosphocytidyl-2-C-methyl-D-erythritol kinase